MTEGKSNPLATENPPSTNTVPAKPPVTFSCCQRINTKLSAVHKDCESHIAGRRSTEAFSALPRIRRAQHTAAVTTKTSLLSLVIILYFPMAALRSACADTSVFLAAAAVPYRSLQCSYEASKPQKKTRPSLLKRAKATDERTPYGFARPFSRAASRSSTSSVKPDGRFHAFPRRKMNGRNSSTLKRENFSFLEFCPL